MYVTRLVDSIIIDELHRIKLNLVVGQEIGKRFGLILGWHEQKLGCRERKFYHIQPFDQVVIRLADTRRSITRFLNHTSKNVFVDYIAEVDDLELVNLVG